MISYIAETAWHHEGDYAFFSDLIDQITESPLDIIKLHVTIDLDEYMSNDHPAYSSLKKWSLSEGQWQDLLKKIKTSKKDLMVLVNDSKAIELVSEFNPNFYELHSVCLNDYHLAKALDGKITKDQKMVVGIGGSSLEEVDQAVSFWNHRDIILMYGFQNYPTRFQDVNFNKLQRYRRLFPHCEFGYADHTAWDHPENDLITYIGAGQGVQYIEKHVTNKYGEQRCDWNSAISLEMACRQYEKLKMLSELVGNGDLALTEAEQKYGAIGLMKKAPIASRNIKAGEEFSLDFVDLKRSGQTSDIPQVNLSRLIGQKINVDKNRGEVFRFSDFFEQKD